MKRGRILRGANAANMTGGLVATSASVNSGPVISIPPHFCGVCLLPLRHNNYDSGLSASPMFCSIELMLVRYYLRSPNGFRNVGFYEC